MHNLLELLFVDLEIWVNSEFVFLFFCFCFFFPFIAGTKEEKKHQVFKHGAKAANPVNTEKQLVRRDAIISTLRYLLHGGGVGPGDQIVLNKAFSTISHPRNLFAPHPILEKVTTYFPGNHFDPYARKFCYDKGSRVTKTLPPTEHAAVQTLLKRTVSSLVIPSKQLVVDGKSFALNDYVSVLGGLDERWFMKITEIVSTSELRPSVLFRGVWLEWKAHHKALNKPIFERGLLSDWQTPQVVERVVLVHHNCGRECFIEKRCPRHLKCPLQCPTVTATVVHHKKEEYLVEMQYKNLSS